MEKGKTKKKSAGAAEKFWPELVEVWFEFCRQKFQGVKPSFDGSSPRDLACIVKQLRTRAEENKIDWTMPIAVKRLNSFLIEAHKIGWLKDNWLLFNINRQKDKIFFNATKQRDDQRRENQQATTETIRSIAADQPASNFGQL